MKKLNWEPWFVHRLSAPSTYFILGFCLMTWVGKALTTDGKVMWFGSMLGGLTLAVLSATALRRVRRRKQREALEKEEAETTRAEERKRASWEL